MRIIDSWCWLCQQPLAITQHGLCSVCVNLLPSLPVCCPRCGLPAQHSLRECPQCQQSPPQWHQLIAASDYCLPIKYFITRLKFYGEDKYAPMLARLLLLFWLAARRTRQCCRPDLLVCVPLHHGRHWRRGFNQCDSIAKPLSHWIGCAYRPTIITRDRVTLTQQSLNASQRRFNLSGAFSCHAELHGLHVALLDDIITTGNTVAEISRLLLRCGAASVQVWCLCRTLKNEGK